MSEPKRWPIHAEEARLEALAEVNRGLQSLRPILDGSAKETNDLVRRVGLVNDVLHQIKHTLVAAGNK